MTDIQRWITVPLPLTVDMEVAFAEAWYSKRRCIDDVEMADAWEAACNAAPESPQDPRTESLQRQVVRLNDMVRNTGKAREKLQAANDELLSLLRESLARDDAGIYSVSMTPSYRDRVRQALHKHEVRLPGVATLFQETADHFQEALETERPGSEQIRGILNDTIARAEAERDAALAQLQALQNEPVSVKLIVVHRGNEVDEPMVTFSPEFARQFDALPPEQRYACTPVSRRLVSAVRAWPSWRFRPCFGKCGPVVTFKVGLTNKGRSMYGPRCKEPHSNRAWHPGWSSALEMRSPKTHKSATNGFLKKPLSWFKHAP